MKIMKKLILLVLLWNMVPSTPILAQCWQLVESSGESTYALRTDGTLWSCGANYQGQLGNGTFTNGGSLSQVNADTDWEQISSNAVHVAAIKSDGTLWTWGWNQYGQLGNGSNTDVNIPTQIGNSTDWKMVSTNTYNTFAIKQDGTLWATGENSQGQLGNGSLVSQNSFVQIGTDADWKYIAVGVSYCFGTKQNGSLWGWGNNSIGQLCTGNTMSTTTPIQIGQDTDWKTVSTGNGHVLAIKQNLSLWAWGNNNYGQVGDGSLVNKTIPTQIGNSYEWVTAEAGFQHSLAVQKDGTNWAWGDNTCYGQMGNGTLIPSSIPVQIHIGSLWENYSAGAFHNGVIDQFGNLLCWGNNTNGQLDDGTFIHKNLPQMVITPCLPLALDALEENDMAISVYPNPTEQLLFIRNGGKKPKEIWNAVGQIVITSTKNEIDVSALPTGVYFLVIEGMKIKFQKYE
jgi:alpha-tubulin suppressor-like RCC1 family protein